MTDVTRATFEAKFEEFLPALQAWQDNHFKTAYSGALKADLYSAERGQKYIRIVGQRRDSSNLPVQYGRSVYCFLDYQGNIYKAAGWKAPAKHIRGSIFDDNFSFGKALTTYGAAYLR